MSHEIKCEGEHVPANHLRAVANPGTRSFPSQRVVGVSHLPNCLPRRSPVTICKRKKNKPNNNGSKKTGSTCLFCSSLMGRRRQRRSTLVWPKRRRRQLFKFGRVQKLCSLCLGPFTRHWQTPWASRESTPLASNGDVASGANAEDDTGNGIGFALGSWRHAIHNTNYTYNTNERTNILSYVVLF